MSLVLHQRSIEIGEIVARVKIFEDSLRWIITNKHMLAHLHRNRFEQLFLPLFTFVEYAMLQNQTHWHACFWTYHSQGIQPDRSIASHYIRDLIIVEKFRRGRYELSVAFVTVHVGGVVAQKRGIGMEVVKKVQEAVRTSAVAVRFSLVPLTYHSNKIHMYTLRQIFH